MSQIASQYRVDGMNTFDIAEAIRKARVLSNLPSTVKYLGENPLGNGGIVGYMYEVAGAILDINTNDLSAPLVFHGLREQKTKAVSVLQKILNRELKQII